MVIGWRLLGRMAILSLYNGWIIVIKLPALRNDQKAIALHPAKRKVLSMGRRWGKTVLGGVIMGSTLNGGGRAAWVTPTYKNGRPLWRWMVQTYAPLVVAGHVSISKVERVITASNGGFFAMYSADNADSIRGDWFHVLINDEAARISDEARFDAIEPTVADSDGEIIDISTPKGLNWFFREFQQGADYANTGIMSWTAPSSANPMPQIQRAYFMARQRLAEHTFMQEWEARFLEGGGLVFRNVSRAVADVRQDEPIADHQYIMGVDWGKHSDFTVLTVIDVTLGHVCYIDRFNQIDYSFQTQRLKVLADKFRPAQVIAEQNSMGDPIIEQLRLMQLPVTPFTTTNATKKAAIEALSLAFERDEIRIPDDAVLIGELQAYELEQLPSGNVRYGAPSGMHDDMVMSLAIGWSGMGGGFRVW